jgi:Fic family protein
MSIKPWLLKNPEETKYRLDKMMKLPITYELDKYKSTCYSNIIYNSNIEESTIWVEYNSKEQYISYLETKYNDMKNYPELKEYIETNLYGIKWFSEGEYQPQESIEAQLEAHQVASIYIHNIFHKEKIITKEHILTTHYILMYNSLSEDKSGFTSGKFRTTKAYSEDYTYDDPEIIVKNIEAVLDRYNTKSENHMIYNAVWLFYNILNIHPFSNGNGRLCRLLFSASLCGQKFPFPVMFSISHRRPSKSYKRYIQAIKSVREYSTFPKSEEERLSQLSTIGLISVVKVLDSYYEKIK